MSLLTNLVSYWSLDETSGSALDAQGTSTLAATGSVGTAAGVVGTARTFAAASHQYLSHADSADLSTGDIDFTFAGWFKLATIGSFPVVFRKGISGAGAREYVLYYDTGASRLTWEVDAASGGAFEILQAGTFGALSAGVWYFFTCWHDSVNNLTGIAINAGTADTASYSAGVLDGTGDFQMGASTDQSLYWDGSIDELGFWKRVLTSAERTSLYNGGAGLGYSSFGGGTPATAAPATATATWAANGPSASGGATAPPATATAAWTANAPSVSAGATAAPSGATAAWTANAPSVSSGGSATAAPATATATWAANAPSASAGATAPPATATATWAAIAPAVSGGAAAAPAAAHATWTANSPAVSAGTPAVFAGGIGLRLESDAGIRLESGGGLLVLESDVIRPHSPDPARATSRRSGPDPIRSTSRRVGPDPLRSTSRIV